MIWESISCFDNLYALLFGSEVDFPWAIQFIKKTAGLLNNVKYHQEGPDYFWNIEQTMYIMGVINAVDRFQPCSLYIDKILRLSRSLKWPQRTGTAVVLIIAERIASHATEPPVEANAEGR